MSQEGVRPPRNNPDSLRRTAEESLSRSGTGRGPRRIEDPEKLQHELNVQQVELEMRNEALQQTCDDLRQAHDRYLRLYEFAPVGYITTDSEGFIRRANLKFATMVQTERTRLGGVRLSRLILEGDRQRFYRFLESVHVPGSTAEVRLVIPDGGQLWALLSAEPNLDELGEVGECFMAVSDISAQKNVEAALAEREQRLRLAASAAQVGIFDWDVPAGKIRWTAEQAAILGYPPEGQDTEASRPLADWMDRIHPEDLPRVGQLLRECQNGRRGFEAEYRIVWPSGRLRWVSSLGDFSRDREGRPIRMLGTTMDVTARNEAEEALRKSHDVLEERVRERTAELDSRVGQLRALAGELSRTEQRERRRIAKLLHDHLQQLLVSAKFRVELLTRMGDDLVRRAAEEIERLLSECINSSRSLTRELSPPVLHDGSLAAGLAWLSRWMADKHGLQTELAVENDLPPLSEDLKILLFESVRELLFNAVKHARVHAAVVNVRKIRDDFLKITVCDDGPGFDPAALTPPGENGGGFGLFSIRERLDLIGGTLEIDSGPGRGSRIVLMAPLSDPAPEEPPA